MPSGLMENVRRWLKPAKDAVPGRLSFSDIFNTELERLVRPAPAVREKPRSDGKQFGPAAIDYSEIDARAEPLVALCLSGGGIRSASFGLGVLQGLARFGLLEKFHYLSTVSGGGYIGSFLTAWRSHENDDTRVFEKLNRPAHDDGKEAEEVASIRAFSNYLTPRVGVFSPDTWTAIVIVIRNLLLNWAIFAPFFMAALLLPRLCRDLLDHFAASTVSEARFFTYGAAVAATIGFAFASYGRRRSEAKWLTTGRFLCLVLLPLVVASILITARTAVLIMRPNFSPDLGARLLGVRFGVSSYVAAWVLASPFLLFWKPPEGTARNKVIDTVFDVFALAVSGALVGYLIVLGMTSAPEWLARGLGRHATQENKIGLLVVAGMSWIMLSVLTGELLFVGLRSYSPRGDMDREWLARSAGWLAVVVASWSLFSAIGLFGPKAFQHGVDVYSPLLAATGLSGVVSLVLGNSAKTAAQTALAAGGRLSLSQIASVAGIIFAVTLAILASWADDQMIDAAVRKYRSVFTVDTHDWRLDAGGLVALGFISLGISYFVNVNRFSLHALYRNRLVRAFLGSARAGQNNPAATGTRRTPYVDPFTQFAQTDNVRMADMPTDRLLHVVNMTLDVVSTSNLAWQQRKAEPFTVTPLSCGNPDVGYRPTKSYGSKDGGMTLGTAMAISGAAVSPNMGSHSSPLLGFLLTLFNLRLGWWLGNPRSARASPREGPFVGLLPLLQELFGQTTDKSRWVYLSDGGHFDNLGLYEMVRRRCRVIVVSDAGCDPKNQLSDLGDCLRKIYIDQGVSIDFRDYGIKARQTPPVTGPYSAIADISYPGAAEPGWLLYIKPGYHGDERADVRSYAEAHGTFPHESTGEQWFDESQLEAYRALGAHVTELLCNHGKPLRPAEAPESLSMARFKASADSASRGLTAPAVR